MQILEGGAAVQNCRYLKNWTILIPVESGYPQLSEGTTFGQIEAVVIEVSAIWCTLQTTVLSLKI